MVDWDKERGENEASEKVNRKSKQRKDGVNFKLKKETIKL